MFFASQFEHLSNFQIAGIATAVVTLIIILMCVILRTPVMTSPLLAKPGALNFYLLSNSWKKSTRSAPYAWDVGDRIMIDFEPAESVGDSHCMRFAVTGTAEQLELFFTPEGGVLSNADPELQKQAAGWKLVGAVVLMHSSEAIEE